MKIEDELKEYGYVTEEQLDQYFDETGIKVVQPTKLSDL